MSVFYKFSSAKDYDTISFSGGHISVAELKEKICEQKKLTNYDLLISNADTKQEYKKPDSLIPKNTVLRVRRAPPMKGFGPKKPIVLSTESTKPTQFSTGHRDTSSLPGLTSGGETSTTAKDESESPMDENEKITNLVNASSSEWLPTRNTGRSFREQRGPGPNYVCHRCNRTGHYIQNCPTNGDPNFNPKRVKKATGIPRAMLRVVGKEQSNGASLVLPDGMYAVMQPNEDAFAQAVGTYQSTGAKAKQIPQQLQCPICREPLNDAVTVPCCGSNFCDECITKTLVEETEFTCPECKKQGILLDSLTPNKSLREAVEDWKRSASSTTSVLPQPPNSTVIQPSNITNNTQNFGLAQDNQSQVSTTTNGNENNNQDKPLNTSESESGAMPIPVVGPNTGKGKPHKPPQRSATVTLTNGRSEGGPRKREHRRGGRSFKEKKEQARSKQSNVDYKGSKEYEKNRPHNYEKKEKTSREGSKDKYHRHSKERDERSRYKERSRYRERSRNRESSEHDRDAKESRHRSRDRERSSKERDRHRSREHRSHDGKEEKDRHRRRSHRSSERYRSSKDYNDVREHRDNDRKRKRDIYDDKEERERKHKRRRSSSPSRHHHRDSDHSRSRKHSHSREEKHHRSSSKRSRDH